MRSRPVVPAVLAAAVLALAWFVLGDGLLFWLIIIGTVTLLVIHNHRRTPN
jgi:hypothetical protein